MRSSGAQRGLFDDPVPPNTDLPSSSTLPSSTPLSVGSILKKYQPKEKNKYVSREFQDFGYRLAMELEDESHKSLYIRLAKTVERGLLESARSFVIDSQAKSKAKLFMWKLKELRAAKVK